MVKRPSSSSSGGSGEHNPWLVAVVVSIATFMEVLDTSIANVSLPHIAGGLASSFDESTWVLTSYLVSNAIVLPISGWLATRIGRKKFYMSCVALFGISSFCCGIAPSLTWLIIFRILQGLGGGGLAPSEQSILADTFPPEQHGQAFALYGIAVVVAPTLGPTLGGWITDNYTWRWVFLINAPFCILSLIMAGWVLPPDSVKQKDQAKSGRIDFLGFVLVAAALGCLQVVLDRGQEDDWFHSDRIIVFSIISGLSLIFLVIWELMQEEPIVDIPLFRHRNFAGSCAMMFIIGFIILETTQLIPQFLQNTLNYNATKAGLALTAGGVATMCMMPIVGGLLKKAQPRWLVIFGLLVEAWACYHLSLFNLGVSFGHVAWARVYQAIGLPFLFISITTACYIGLPAHKRNNASALINAMRNLGGSFGISMGQTVLARRGQYHHARLAESLTPFSQAIQSHHLMSPKALDAITRGQVDILSINDAFRLVAWIALAALPVVFLMRRVKPEEQEGEG